MKRIILSGILGGIVLTLWGVLSWMVLPLHKDTIKHIPEEDKIAAVLSETISKQGVYTLPYYSQDLKGEEQELAMKLWEEKYKKGPIATIFYRPKGSDPMMMQEFISGFIINIISALLAAWFLSRSTAVSQSYFSRVSFVASLAVFASVAVYLVEWNWMLVPFKYTTAMIVDLLAGWIFVGLVIGGIISRQEIPKIE